jgi:hypothetical protein
MLRCAPAFARLPLRGASLGPTAASYYNADILTVGGLSRRRGGVQTDLHLESHQIKDIHKRDEDIPHGSHPAMGTILVGMATTQQFEGALAAVQKGPLPSAALERLAGLQQTFAGELR